MMKKVFTYCVIAVVALTLGACTPKIDKATLDKKIENRDPEKCEFTTEEYAFMADYLSKHFDEIGDDDEEGTKFVYLMLLGEANNQGKLKGKVQKQFSELNQKFDERMDASFKEAEAAIETAMQGGSEDDDIVEVVEYVEADGSDTLIGY